MKHRILLVEDETHLAEVIRMNLELEGYEVETADDGVKAKSLIKGQSFHLFILDVMLPSLNGFDLCEWIRKDDLLTPVLFLTAKETPADKIKGLKAGADDYLTKPFNLEEFLLRVKVLIRHSVRAIQPARDLQIFRFGLAEINFITFQGKDAHGQPIELTTKELALMKLLVEREGEVVSRNQIMQYVWEYDVFPTTRTVDNFIRMLRLKFEPNPDQPVHIHSVRGVGYKFSI